MTPAQLATLKAGILADPTAAAFSNDEPGNKLLAGYLNTVPAAATAIWRPVIPVVEMSPAIDWSAYAVLTTAKQQTYLALTQGGVIDATSSAVRAAFTTIFGVGATLTALTALAQRNATRFEALFTAGGVCSVYGQTALAWECAAARNS